MNQGVAEKRGREGEGLREGGREEMEGLRKILGVKGEDVGER